MLIWDLYLFFIRHVWNTLKSYKCFNCKYIPGWWGENSCFLLIFCLCVRIEFWILLLPQVSSSLELLVSLLPHPSISSLSIPDYITVILRKNSLYPWPLDTDHTLSPDFLCSGHKVFFPWEYRKNGRKFVMWHWVYKNVGWCFSKYM